MTIICAKLRINDSEFDILRMSYGFYRKTDRKGRPGTGLRGGNIYVLIESGTDNYLLRQMLLEEVPSVRGSIEVMTGQDEQRMRYLEFESAYIFSQEEVMFGYSSYPMLTTIAISPVRFDIDGKVRLDRRWPETYGFWWQEYKAEGERGRMAGSEKINESNEVKPEIVSVEIIDDNDEALSGEIVQYVNLKKEAVFIDGTQVTGLYQLGHVIRCKVTFNKPGCHNFKIKLVPDPGNISYSATEKGRCVNFERQEAELSLTTDSNGEIIVEGDKQLFLDQAGGNIYKISAVDDDGKTVESSATIKTERMLYYIKAEMQGLNSTLNSFSQFESEYKSHHIICNKIADDVMSYMKNIDTAVELDVFLANADNVYKRHNSKAPYDVLVACADHIAIKNPAISITTLRPVYVGPGRPPVLLPVRYRGKSYPLWHNISEHDSWFVRGSFTDSRTGRITAINEIQCTPIPIAGSVDNCKSISVDVEMLPVGVGTIRLEVNCVKRMSGGFSVINTNVIAVAARSWWKPYSVDKQNKILIHEIGHKVGMVPKGTKLDQPVNYYDERSSPNHRGPHCHAGIPVQARYDNPKTDKPRSTCVMYGSSNTVDFFCPDCAECVRKTDISDGTNY